jgi:hypothetical protein
MRTRAAAPAALFLLAGAGLRLAAGQLCAQTHPLVGRRLELAMLGRQTRARVEVRSDCELEIAGFEVWLPAGEQAVWWAAAGAAPVDMAGGFALIAAGSATELRVNTSASGASLSAALPLGRTLDEVGVVGLRDAAPGGVLHGLAQLQKLRPGATAELVTVQRPSTAFDSCRQLSDRLRVRWSVGGGSVEFGLEGVVPAGAYLSFGPADPATANRRMGGADVLIGGLRADGAAFAVDAFIAGYEVCDRAGARAVDGVCDDASWAGDPAASDVELVYAQTMEGVTLVRLRRPLVTADARFDHPLDVTQVRQCCSNTGYHFATHLVQR